MDLTPELPSGASWIDELSDEQCMEIFWLYVDAPEEFLGSHPAPLLGAAMRHALRLVFADQRRTTTRPGQAAVPDDAVPIVTGDLSLRTSIRVRLFSPDWLHVLAPARAVSLRPEARLLLAGAATGQGGPCLASHSALARCDAARQEVRHLLDGTRGGAWG